MSLPAVIYGAGMSCPLGRYARAAFIAVNAGIRRFVEVANVTDPSGEPARACRLSSLEEDDSYTRALWFAQDAIAEALQPLAETRGLAVPVFVSASPAVLVEGGRQALKMALQGAAPAQLDLTWNSRSITSAGRAGGVLALEAALAALETSPLVLVGGLDSHAAGDALRALADANRLLGSRNCDGRLPGEGAAFILLGRLGVLPRQEVLGVVRAIARSSEPRPFAQDRASQATGLSQVFAALRNAWAGRVDEVVMAQSTERFWGSELSVAYLRNVELMPEPMRTRQLANVLGDCAAAAFFSGILWALDDFRVRPSRRDPPIRSALIYSSSDTGLVGGAILAAASSIP